MKNVKVLDCTLRDGGRIIDCKFNDTTINNISNDLSNAGIDIVEIGFIRDKKLVTYEGNSTFFTEVSQMNPFVNETIKTLFVAFIDYGMYDFEYLEECANNKIKGIRVGFTKNQFDSDKSGIMRVLALVKEKGYKLFVQGVNTLGYSDRELLDVIEMVNEIKPYCFGIVDTYGAMYLDDLTHTYNLVEHNLNLEICIDIHMHNNFQSSFSFSQEIIRIADVRRNVILDSTLNGMGKCAGNLNTELIVDYLNRKKGANYDLDRILDIIDRYLSPIKEEKTWGYSIPAFMAGIYKSHPNNIIYLTEKYRLTSKDIKYIISAIDEETRQRYDYDNIQQIYQDYCSSAIEDGDTIRKITNILLGKTVVLLAPGKSIESCQNLIKDRISASDAISISVNFVPEKIDCDFYFYANIIHWGKVNSNIEKEKCILTSNIHENIKGAIRVNYSSLIIEDSKMPDNSTMMLLNLLRACGVKKVLIAGFDGMRVNEENYVNDNFINSGHGWTMTENNEMIKKMYLNFVNRNLDSMEISIITPSLYVDTNEA